MAVSEYCPSCNEGILWKCIDCEKENDRSVHTYHQSPRELPNTVPASTMGVIVCLASVLVSAV